MGLGVCVKFMLVKECNVYACAASMHIILTIAHVYVLLYAFVIFPGFI